MIFIDDNEAMAHNTTHLLLNVGRRIAELRISKGLTQDAFAEKIGVTGGYIRQVESGKQNLTLTSMNWLADELDCKPVDFFQKSHLEKQKRGRPKKRKK